MDKTWLNYAKLLNGTKLAKFNGINLAKFNQTPIEHFKMTCNLLKHPVLWYIYSRELSY